MSQGEDTTFKASPMLLGFVYAIVFIISISFSDFINVVRGLFLSYGIAHFQKRSNNNYTEGYQLFVCAECRATLLFQDRVYIFFTYSWLWCRWCCCCIFCC